MTGRFENGFGGRVAAVTGGGTGMGRDLVLQLTADGCDVATCDVIQTNLDETALLAASNPGELLTHIADVSDEDQVTAFAVAVADWRPHVNLLFNNAGIGGGGTIIDVDREQWEKVFNVCWYGVYYNTLAFLPALLAADVGQVVNTSSINGFFASLGPGMPHTSYSAAKFAVKGFTEALITDFAQNAPHLRASVVMPGHIGTSITENSDRLLGIDNADSLRERYAQAGRDASEFSDEDLMARLERRGENFKERAPTSAAQAATIILDAVKHDEWRILVGEDALVIDDMVRKNPEGAYDPEFYASWVEQSKSAR
ncbi:MAG: NAD(P)-dependent dehydrogenase (short-subunit alcohol dehydrogenase family) [Candidatus Poriferisodalaceae bacterium]|jgi:NAD(P)-dependent dehydrogenase (short-subunit alcohol dehydrogenase family)